MPTTFKTGSTLAVPNGGAYPGVTITASSIAANYQGTLFVSDYVNDPIFEVSTTPTPSAYCWGDKFLTYKSTTGGSGIGFRADQAINGVTNSIFSITVLEFPDGPTYQGLNLRAGTGAPSSTTTAGWAEIGDVYERRDGSAGTYTYVCTSAGYPGTATWVAVL